MRKLFKVSCLIKTLMVLESLINPFTAEKKPWEMLFLGFLYSTIGLFLALWIFEEESSLVMVFFSVMASFPIVFYTIKFEEKKDLQAIDELGLLKEHEKALMLFVLLFLGMTFAFTLWYLVLPQTTSDAVFSVQTATILNINNKVSGDLIGSFKILTKILINNFKVLIFSILFSFIYGAGAIFILTWNASVIATALGNFIDGQIVMHGTVTAVGLGLLRYFIHGIPEIAAYFVGGLAGGIISVAIIKHHFSTKYFDKILLDASHLITIAAIMLVVAGIIEVFVTPLFF